MTATAAKYLPRYYSEIVREAIGSFDDCAICSGLTLYDAATMGEGVTRDDGRLMDTIRLRELRDEAGLAPDGPLRLNDVAKYLRWVSEKVDMAPPFELDHYPGHPGGTLRVTWAEFKDRIQNGHVGILLGNPIAVKDPASPLRSRQVNDDYGHAVGLMDGRAETATLFDPLTRKGPDWRGEWVPWQDLRQFTEARKGGARLYGTADAIGCALARIGSETEAARAERKAAKRISTLMERVDAQKAQTELHRDERDDALARLLACEARECNDCTDLARQLEAERDGALERANMEADRATDAEDRIRRAVEVLTA